MPKSRSAAPTLAKNKTLPDAPPSSGTSSGVRRLGWSVLAILGTALVAYHNTFSVPFLLDDLPAILDGNPTIRTLWPLWEVLSPPAGAGVGGRPLVNLTLALNYAWGEFDVRSYHAVNLAIHAAAALTLFGLMRRTLLLPSLRPRFGDASNGLAVGTSLLWLAHPLQTEAVTYVSQRSESLMGLFFFLTLYGCVRSSEATGRRMWQAISVVACFCGALSKEVIAVAPLAVMLFDRTFMAGSFRGAWHARRGYYAALAGTWIVLAFLMHDLAQRGVGFTHAVTWWEYALTSCRSVVLYFKLAAWPHPLVFDYGAGVVRRFGEVLPQAILVVVLLAGTLAALRWRPKLGWLGAWVFLTLAPTTSFVPVALQPTAEHRMYLPLAGLCAGSVLALYTWWGRRSALVVAAIVAACTAATISRNNDYRSELSLWDDTVKKSPGNVRARTTLGSALVEARRLEEGRRQFEAALQLDPHDLDAHLNLGNALLLLGRVGESVPHYEAIVRARPDYAEGRYNLGNALLALGRKEAAVLEFETAAKLKFTNPELHRRLGEIFIQLQRQPDAIREYRASLAKDNASPASVDEPHQFDAHLKLAMLLSEKGAAAEAIPHLEAALRLRPDDANTHNDLGVALSETGRLAEARGHFEAALRLNPNLDAAKRNLQRLPR